MEPGRWRQFGVVAACALAAGAAAAAGLPAFAVLALVAMAGIGSAAILAFRAPGGGDAPAQPRTDRGPLAIGTGRYLLDRVPGPLILIDARGRVAYANGAARAMLPRLEPGAHYTNLFRASGFLEGVTEVLAGAAERQVGFTAISAGVEQHMSAEMRRLDAAGEFGSGPQVLIQLADQTERMATDRMRTDFIANASHELRTPLASIIGYIETLRGHARDDEAARTHFLGTMAAQAARMQRLVEDLMSLSRIEMDAHTPPTTASDLGDLAREAGEGMRPLAQRREAVLDVRVDPVAAPVIADRDQIGQVFANLIENAMKYGGAGSTVTVSRAAPDARFPGMVGIAVADDGPGIAREHLHRLTERFYRVNAKMSREQGGTGLGLAIVKHILARHGGELDVASTPGKGSTFTVWLPQAAKTPQRESAVSQS